MAVSSLGKEASLSLRQLGVLKGESLFNDASGIVGFQFAIAAAITGEVRDRRAAGEFALSFIGGAVYGLTIGPGSRTGCSKPCARWVGRPPPPAY